MSRLLDIARSLLQKNPTKIGLVFKRDLAIQGAYSQMPPRSGVA